MSNLQFTDQQLRNLDTLETFVTELEKKLGYEALGEIYPEICTNVLRPNGKSRYQQKLKNVHVLTFKTECYKLKLIPSTENCIEVYWIEVKDTERCRGLGSELMNTILDISDELNIKVKAIPCDMMGDGTIEVLYRIRNWYRSLGFKPSKIEPASYHYLPKKNLVEQEN